MTHQPPIVRLLRVALEGTLHRIVRTREDDNERACNHLAHFNNLDGRHYLTGGKEYTEDHRRDRQRSASQRPIGTGSPQRRQTKQEPDQREYRDTEQERQDERRDGHAAHGLHLGVVRLCECGVSVHVFVIPVCLADARMVTTSRVVVRKPRLVLAGQSTPRFSSWPRSLF